MIAKGRYVLFAVVALVLVTAAEAKASSWTDVFKINFMDTSATDGGYSVAPMPGTLANNSTNDPSDCIAGSTPIDRINLYASNLTQTQKDFLARTLLAAYLSGRYIRLQVSGAGCSGGKPMYGNVAIYPAQ